MSTTVLEIDGSYLEGGGQILRMALSLSCILRRPIRVTKIRANRPKPGLSNQHLFGLNLLQQICNARVTGNHMQSTEIEFHPNAIKGGSYLVDTHTAASVTLVLQAVIPVLLFADQPSDVELRGGTNVGMAPQVDFMTEVLRPNLELFGVSFDFDLVRRGYYPKGGGCCKVHVPIVPHIKPADICNFGSVSEISGWCFVAGNMPPRLADNMKEAANQKLCSLNMSNIYLESYKENLNMAKDNGSGVILKAITTSGCTIGASTLGERHVNAEALGATAAEQLCAYISNGTCVDEHVQDQLIIFMTLATGKSRIHTCALTKHTRTAIHVAELMTGVKFEVEDAANEHVIISCEGRAVTR